jgi:hypothetical protein
MLTRLIFAGLLTLSFGATVTQATAQCGGVPRAGGPAPEAPAPAAPSTPSPSTPSTPSPSTPNTPSPGTPTPTVSGPTTPRGPRGGIALNVTRQSTSREVLSIDWDYPTREADKTEEVKGRTAAAKVLRALPKPAAFVKISGDDKRPLLVLRECPYCKGTDFAFLNRKLKNEKTMLLARWFHCIKLPPSVVHPTHHFRNLFAGKEPPHLFIAKSDGSDLQPFDGKQTQSKMQAAMTKMIKDCYQKDPKPALRSMLRFLSDFDHCDTMEETILKRIKKELYAKGPKSSKLKKLRGELDAMKAKKAKAMKRAKAVCDLKLKVDGAPKPKPKTKKVGGGGD